MYNVELPCNLLSVEFCVRHTSASFLPACFSTSQGSYWRHLLVMNKTTGVCRRAVLWGSWAAAQELTTREDNVALKLYWLCIKSCKHLRAAPSRPGRKFLAPTSLLLSAWLPEARNLLWPFHGFLSSTKTCKHQVLHMGEVSLPAPQHFCALCEFIHHRHTDLGGVWFLGCWKDTDLWDMKEVAAQLWQPMLLAVVRVRTGGSTGYST